MQVPIGNILIITTVIGVGDLVGQIRWMDVANCSVCTAGPLANATCSELPRVPTLGVVVSAYLLYMSDLPYYAQN
jgi:hypothetical protein